MSDTILSVKDDKTEIILILVDHRIYWETKNETNNYTFLMFLKYAEPIPNTGILNLLSEIPLSKYPPYFSPQQIQVIITQLPPSQ